MITNVLVTVVNFVVLCTYFNEYPLASSISAKKTGDLNIEKVHKKYRKTNPEIVTSTIGNLFLKPLLNICITQITN